MSDLSFLKDWLDYQDGKLFWKKSPKVGVLEGAEAGYSREDGYRAFAFKNKDYLSHRVIFFFHYGYLPKLVDHINQNTSDNRIENLREIDRRGNTYNTSKLWRHNTSGVRGVSWDSKQKKWTVRFKHEGKYGFYGYYESVEEAAKVRQELERRFLQ
mgnify:CR=1 FL=1